MQYLFVIFLVVASFANEWSITEGELKFVKENIEFSNRAACAKKSLEPTIGVFLLIDNVNIAKSVYRLAKLKGIDPIVTTNHGIEKFRYTVANLVRMISSRLLSKDLPMVKENGHSDEILKANWDLSKKMTNGKSTSCKVIKKFSALQANLRISRPDHFLMEELAKQLQSKEDYVIDCEDFSDLSQPEVALLQFNIFPGDNFKVVGFDFWYSLKLYLSWAFRNSKEGHNLSYPFDYVFQSLNLEEMLLFFSSSCKSIVHPHCSDKDLSLHNLSFLTQSTNTIDWSSSTFNRPVLQNIPEDMISRPLPSLEEDLLNLGDFKSATDWAKNFRDNFIRARGFNKIKLSKAINILSLISSSVSADTIFERIQDDVVSLNDSRRQELYYLCSEYSLAFERELSFLRKDLLRLKEISLYDELLAEQSNEDLDSLFTYFETLEKSVSTFCHNLNQKQIWDDQFKLNKSGFANWYQQIVYDKKITFQDGANIFSEEEERPFLKFSQGGPLCQNGLHCARQFLDSILTLSSISHTFLSLVPNKEIISTEMSNPYSSAVACGAYDPWAKRNKIIFDFFQDMAQTAVFGFVPTPIYIGASLDPKRIVSFETLIKEGQVYYDPQFDHHRLKLSLMADLGPLMGIPCSISISGSRENPFQYYTFKGVSFSTCRERAKSDVIVESGDEQSKHSRYRQVCASCALNMQTVSSSASIINPLFRTSFFLIKGVTRLMNQLKDPNDLIHSWSLSSHDLALSYRYHGKITKKCAKKILKGKSCLEKKCERDMLKEFTYRYHVTPVSSHFSCLRGEGKVRVKECPSIIGLKGEHKLEIRSKCRLKERE